MLRPLYIALLELRLFVSSRGELAFSLALPVLLFALMYGALSSEPDFFTPASVVDLDRGAPARELVRRLDALPEISVEERSAADANAALERSAILFAIVIPAGFSAAMDAGEAAPLVFRQRGSGGETGQIVAAVARGIVRDLASEARLRRFIPQTLADSGAAPERIAAEVEAQLARLRANPPVITQVRRAGGDAAESGDNGLISRLMPGMVVMFLMFSVTLGAQALVEERRSGTLERLMTTRLGVNQLFLGKFLAGVARAMLQAAVMLALAFIVFRPAGALTFAQLMAFTVLTAAAFSGVALVIGAAARTRSQASWAAVFFTLLMMVFGGTFFEISDGTLLDTISKATINAYAIDAMSNLIANGEGLGRQWLPMAVMAGVAAVSLVIARLLFRITPEGR